MNLTPAQIKTAAPGELTRQCLVNILARDPDSDFDPINDAGNLFTLLREWVRLGGGWKLRDGPKGFEALAWRDMEGDPMRDENPIRHSITDTQVPAVAIMRCILTVLAGGGA